MASSSWKPSFTPTAVNVAGVAKPLASSRLTKVMPGAVVLISVVLSCGTIGITFQFDTA